MEQWIGSLIRRGVNQASGSNIETSWIKINIITSINAVSIPNATCIFNIINKNLHDKNNVKCVSSEISIQVEWDKCAKVTRKGK